MAAVDLSPTRSSVPVTTRRYFDFDAIRMLCERDITRYLRERTQLYGSIARTVVWLFILGAGLRGSVNVPGDFSYLEFVFPGMLAMAIIFSSLQSAISIIFDRQFGFLREILVAPIPRTSVVIGKALSGALISTLQGSIIFLFIPFIGLNTNLIDIILCIFVMIGIGLGLTSVGVCISARMTSFEGFGTINNFVILPLYFTSGAQFPLDRAPHWLRILAHFNPLTYGVDLLRGILLGSWVYNPWLDVAVIAGIAICFMTLATRIFERQE
jgi:ABC-2 type transport system permease protein